MRAAVQILRTSRTRPKAWRGKFVAPKPSTARAVATVFGAIFVLTVNGAIADEPEGVPVKREILALFDGGQEGSAESSRLHRFAELPLNHLGLTLHFHDVRDPLPDPSQTTRYRGVITWFAGPIPHGDAYLAWANRLAQQRMRYVILGDVGVALNSANLLAVNRLLALTGVRHTGDLIGPTLGSRVAQKDASLVEFECRLETVLPDFPVVLAVGAGTRRGVIINTPEFDGTRKSVPVAIGERGGYAAWGYEMRHQRPPLFKGRWLINPFDFFRAGFGLGAEPIPDTSTASGNRLYFSIFDSDGLMRISKVENSPAPSTVGDVARREFVESFPDLPATFELHGEALTRAEQPGTSTQQLVRKILADGNVDLLRRGLQATRSRFDFDYPSISNLAPLLNADRVSYVNQPMSDESGYESSSGVGENAYEELAETLHRTETPRRLKPAVIHYHAYSGGYPALMRSVKALLREQLAASLTPISANRYAAIVDGYFGARIEGLSSKKWRITDRGALTTVRFDDAAAIDVDYASSIGVIGSRRSGSTLYVALDEAVEAAVVALAPSSSEPPPGRLALVQSRWLVRRFFGDACSATFEAQGYGPGSFTWSGASTTWEISVERAGREIWRGTGNADALGRIDYVIPASAVTPLQVRMRCASPTAP